MYKGNPIKHREYARQKVLELKRVAFERYSANAEKLKCQCGESRLICLTLSHLAPTPAFPQKGLKLYRALKKAGYPDLPLLVECINCNVARDNWGHGYK